METFCFGNTALVLEFHSTDKVQIFSKPKFNYRCQQLLEFNWILIIGMYKLKLSQRKFLDMYPTSS